MILCMSSTWYDEIKLYTERLVGMRSVSPGQDEIYVAQEIVHLLQHDELGTIYTESGLDALEGDLYGRQNAYAFLRGSSASTVVLLGHFDTVDTQDYGALEPWSLEPVALAERSNELLPAGERESDLSDWMFGRGAADMKSGVAINIALMRQFAREARLAPLPLSIVLIATPDEENNSAGVLQAVRFLQRLRSRYRLNYIGLLNTDYVTALYPGDEHRYIYAGTIGKLLPGFLCIGSASHAGDPFNGLDANLLAAELIRDLSMNDELCDAVPGQLAAPPVTLRASDLKEHYDVQLPLVAYFYLNVLTLTTTPAQLLTRLRQRAEDVLAQLLRRIDQTEQRWRQAHGEQRWLELFKPRSGGVLTYDLLYGETVQRLGKERVEAELMQEWQRWPAKVDGRDRSLHLVHRLWTLSGRQGPAVVLYFAPPYYPAVPPIAGPLQDAVDAVIKAHPEVDLEQQAYFPYLSDISYMHLDPNIDLVPLQANMPAWQPEHQPILPGAYSLPIKEIQSLNIPAINWGPFGRGAHQRDEAVLMSYAFDILPQLLYETIQHMGKSISPHEV
ncbi:MAG: M20 family metallopeptidase [Ktedonobacteraceae bacterium]